MKEQLPHLRISESETRTYRGRSAPIQNPRPQRNRAAHSALLQKQLTAAWAAAESEEIVCHADRHGIYLEFKGEAGFSLATKSLEDFKAREESCRTRLLNVRKEDVTVGGEIKETIFATVYVPKQRKEAFFDKLTEYATQLTRSGSPKNAELIERIAEIRKADAVESFWLDEKKLIPQDNAEWCEVWLSSDQDVVIARFEALLKQLHIACRPGFIRFPERAVKVICASRSQLAHFSSINMTSAAAAQAAWFAAQIQARYSDYWPETIRALMVHSANWTPAMQKQFMKDVSKRSYETLLKSCGYGVPDLEKALYSAGNSLTLIAQSELQPFDKTSDYRYVTRDMHLYELPWPREVLEALPDGVEVRMRVTLSYFIEPGPGEKGWKDRYRYASHALRFDLNSPRESQVEFIRRINIASRDEDSGHPGTASAADYWTLGTQLRNKGSIHSDIWKGTARDLATSNIIAVYPVIGWWRERHHLQKWNRRARYSLIVSIETSEQSVDIYTPVAIRLGVTVPIKVTV